MKVEEAGGGGGGDHGDGGDGGGVHGPRMYSSNASLHADSESE